MSKIDRRQYMTAGGAAVIGGLIGYFGHSTINSDSNFSLSTTSDDTIKIGATLPLSGAYSPVAGSFENLYLTWAEMINERGGIYIKEQGKRLPVEFIIYDDQSDHATAIRLYTKLIENDNVDVLIGPYSSTLTIPIVPIVTDAQVPLIATTAAAPPIFNQGSEWVFAGIDLLSAWPKHYFDMVAAKGEAKTIAFVVGNEPYGQGLLVGGSKLAHETGLEIVLQETVSPGTKDFTPSIIKLKALDPDIIFVGLLAPDASTFVSQAHQQGLNPREYHVTQLIKPFIESVGSDVANNITGEWYWTPDLPYSGYYGKTFFIELMERADLDNNDHPWAAVHFYALEILGAALEDAGSLEKPAIQQSLKNLNMLTISGNVHFSDSDVFKGVGSLTPFPVQLQNGEIQVIWPNDVSDSEYIYPGYNYYVQLNVDDSLG